MIARLHVIECHQAHAIAVEDHLTYTWTSPLLPAHFTTALAVSSGKLPQLLDHFYVDGSVSAPGAFFFDTGHTRSRDKRGRTDRGSCHGQWLQHDAGWEREHVGLSTAASSLTRERSVCVTRTVPRAAKLFRRRASSRECAAHTAVHPASSAVSGARELTVLQHNICTPSLVSQHHATHTHTLSATCFLLLFILVLLIRYPRHKFASKRCHP